MRSSSSYTSVTTKKVTCGFLGYSELNISISLKFDFPWNDSKPITYKAKNKSWNTIGWQNLVGKTSKDLKRDHSSFFFPTAILFCLLETVRPSG